MRMLSSRRRLRVSLLMAVAACVAATSVIVWRWRNRQVSRPPPTRVSVTSLATAADSHGGRAPAEEWPQWLGPRLDGISREIQIADGWPADGPPRLWEAEVGLGHASPIALGGRVYVFTNLVGREALTAFDAATGKLVWSVESPCSWSGTHPGTRASPVIAADRIYTFGASGDLICRSLSDGAPRWAVNVLTTTGAKNLRWGASSPPLLAGGRIYVQGGAEGPTCVAVDASTGALAWQSESKRPAGYARVTMIRLGEREQLVVFGGDSIIAMDPGTGRTIWTEPWPTKEHVNCTPPLCSDGHLFVTSGEGQGAAMWKLADAQKPTRLWENRDLQGYFQSPILEDGHVYINNAGILTCLKFPTGEITWSANDPQLRMNYGGSMVRVGDKLILLSARGRLSLLQASPTGFRRVAQVQVLEGAEIYATPLLYAGRLYLKGMHELICLDAAQAQ